MPSNFAFKKFNQLLLGIGSFLAVSCANQTTSSNKVYAPLSTKDERAPLTKPPKQVLTGKWTNGKRLLNLHASGNCDMPDRVIGPESNRGVPQGMLLVDGLLKKGESIWSYEGNSSEGILKVEHTYFDEKISSGHLFKINFINDGKIIGKKIGDSEAASVYLIKLL